MKNPVFLSICCMMMCAPASMQAQDTSTGIAGSKTLPYEQLTLPDSLFLPHTISYDGIGTSPVRDFGGNRPALHLPQALRLNESLHMGRLDGGTFGYGNYTSMPGLGNFGSATIGIAQNLGSLTLTGAISGYKYHVNRNLYNDFGVSGSITYHINERLSLSVFGNYSAGNPFDSPAAMPYMNHSCFGGSIRYQTGSAFGMELGVRRMFDPFMNRWTMMPIVAPSFKLGKHSFGVDLGGAILGIIDNLRSNSGNHMIGPAPDRRGGSLPTHLLKTARETLPH